MSTLAEIEAALPQLSESEIETLEDRLRELRATRRVFTGEDAVRWWNTVTHLSPDEADRFADDVEVGRREMNRPPTAPRWE